MNPSSGEKIPSDGSHFDVPLIQFGFKGLPVKTLITGPNSISRGPQLWNDFWKWNWGYTFIVNSISGSKLRKQTGHVAEDSRIGACRLRCRRTVDVENSSGESDTELWSETFRGGRCIIGGGANGIKMNRIQGWAEGFQISIILGVMPSSFFCGRARHFAGTVSGKE